MTNARAIVGRENSDPLLAIAEAREHFMNAVVAMFNAIPLLGYNNPAKFLDDVLTRLNNHNMSKLLEDPDAPQELKDFVKETLDAGGLTPSTNDETIKTLIERFMPDAPVPSAQQEGYGTYL